LQKHRLLNQPKISTQFKAASPLPDAEKKKLRLAQIRLCAAKGLPLSLYESQEFKNFIGVVLKDHVCKDRRVNEICVSPRTIGRFCDQQAELNLSDLKILLPSLIESGSVNLMLDHKWIPCDKNGKSKVLGVSISLISDDLKRKSFMLEYYPTRSSSASENLPILRNLLESNDLLEACESGKICIITDEAASSIASALSPQGAICASHSHSCALKRSIEKLVVGNAKNKWSAIVDLVDQFGKKHDFSSLPFKEAAPSMNIYCSSQPVQNREHIEAWRASKIRATWTEIKLPLGEVEQHVEMVRNDCYGKTLERNLKSTTRFRKYSSACRDLLLNQSLVEPLLADRGHPHFFLGRDCRDIDWFFLREIEPTLTRLERSINRFESDSFQVGYGFLEEQTNLVVWTIRRMETLRRCSASEAYHRALLTAFIEQLTSVHIDHHGIVSRPLRNEMVESRNVFCRKIKRPLFSIIT